MNKKTIELGETALAPRGAFRHGSKEFELMHIEWNSGERRYVVKPKRGSVEEKLALREMLEMIMNAKVGERKIVAYFRPIWETGRFRRHMTYSVDHTSDYLKAVDRLKEIIKGNGIRVKVTHGNDAPRGGKLGDRIDVTIYLPKVKEEK